MSTERHVKRRQGATCQVPVPPDLDVVRFEIDGQSMAVLSFSIPALNFPPALSASEREIAGLLAAGQSVQAIARHRRRSSHTVVNQIRAIYFKLGVGSRTEMVHRLVAPEDE